MKKNNKGFTLIELLAVIIILAIIALIAVPTVMGIIDDARKGAAEDATYGLISAAETVYAKSMMNSGTATNPTWATVKTEIEGTAPADSPEPTFVVIDGKIGVKSAKFYDKYTCTNVKTVDSKDTVVAEVTCS